MEENREPQQVAAAPAAYQPVYPAPQNPYYAPPPVKAGRWMRTRRIGRLLLRRLWYGSTVVARLARPYAAFIVVTIALLGVIGWMSYMLWGPKDQPATFDRAQSLPPAAAVETYIKGQQSFNADMMWDAYSTDYQANQLANGASKATLQAQASSQRSAGLQYVHYDYIGGVPLDNGSMYFYSVDLSLQNQRARFPIIFKADQDGKIIGIDSPLTRLGTSENSQ
ncbi:MAG TPA: hypothetical protein VFU22_06235 [Roseiflexaceae bacterium]|nr:hypothetical protein [Roseiflexaceae bacterium]